MGNTLRQMHHKIAGAEQLESVVRTMKAQAAANITQYETAVLALADYCRTIDLGLNACFHQTRIRAAQTPHLPKQIVAIVFGSDQGLVGQFNDQLADYVISQLAAYPFKTRMFVVGERISGHMSDAGFTPQKTFSVPATVHRITPLVGEILLENVNFAADIENSIMLVFYNRSDARTVYRPTHQQLLPLDVSWQDRLAGARWPTGNLPELINDAATSTLGALIREHVFISLFRACAESLASENASRLMAMSRAEKNIDGLLEELKHTARSLRQNTIDEELFDVITSYEYSK